MNLLPAPQRGAELVNIRLKPAGPHVHSRSAETRKGQQQVQRLPRAHHVGTRIARQLLLRKRKKVRKPETY
jgi:hypothetical protein